MIWQSASAVCGINNLSDCQWEAGAADQECGAGVADQQAAHVRQSEEGESRATAVTILKKSRWWPEAKHANYYKVDYSTVIK